MISCATNFKTYGPAGEPARGENWEPAFRDEDYLDSASKYLPRDDEGWGYQQCSPLLPAAIVTGLSLWSVVVYPADSGRQQIFSVLLRLSAGLLNC